MSYKPEGYRITTEENHLLLSSVTGIEHAVERRQIAEGIALLCDSDFTLHFDLGCMRGIMPRQEVQYTKSGEETKDIAILTRVGKPTCFKILSVHYDIDGKPYALLSRRAAQAECLYQWINTLTPGDILSAKVTHLESFGAFVDIGCGMIALLPIDAISVSRISHPRDRFEVGDSIFCVVKTIDEQGRIYVSQRELLGTWEENAGHFSVGQTVTGIVRSIESYGVFIELLPNLAGLAECKENVKVGTQVAVYIKSILPDKMKLKLVLIDDYGTPAPRLPLTYYIDTKRTAHLSTWLYSPKGCSKKIESQFT